MAGMVLTFPIRDAGLGEIEEISRGALLLARDVGRLCQLIQSSSLPLARKAEAMSELVDVGRGIRDAFAAIVQEQGARV